MPLITCPDCNKQVSDQAEACPHCGHPIAHHVRATAKPSLTTLGWLSVLVLAGIAIFATSRSNTPKASSANDSSASSEATPQPTSYIPWRTIDEIYNVKSKYTNLQKDQEWKGFKGERVQWTGKVSSISQSFGSVVMQVKMNPDTWTSDIIITLKDSEKSKAARLQQGDSVTFVATLDRWGTLLPISMKDGEIVE